MANLNKLLVHVPSSLCPDFRNKYIKDGANRNKSYDSKVVFLEDTKEIFTKGKIYGTNVEDFNALKELVGTIPSGGGTTSTNIVDYINEKFGKLGTAAYKNASDFETTGAAEAVKRELLGTTNDTYTYNTIYGVKDYVIFTYNKLIGSEYDAPTDCTIYGAKNYAKEILPVVTAGPGINVKETTDYIGKKTYEVSTSAEVFHYKGNKTTIEELPSTDNSTGDVWSVGPANATGSTLYTWDGDEWINIGSADGITDIDKTDAAISHGVKLVKNPDGTIKANVEPGKVKENDTSVVTGGEVYSYIKGLKGSASSGNAGYVTVGVTTYGGKVNGVTVTNSDALKTAVSYANNALQQVKVLGYTLNKSSYSITAKQVKDALNLGEAAYEDIAYFTEYFVSKSSIGGDATVIGRSSYIDVSVTTYNGRVKTVTVTPTEELENLLSYAYNSVQSIDTFSNPYISIYKNEIDNKNYYVNFDVSEVFSYVTNNIWETYPPE